MKMTKCSNCGAELQPNQKFCVECGTKLDLLCANCGAKLEPKYKFCINCGTRVNGKKAAIQDAPKRDKISQSKKKTKREFTIDDLGRAIITISFAETTYLGDVKNAVNVLMYEEREVVDLGFCSTFDIADFDPEDIDKKGVTTLWSNGDYKKAAELFDAILDYYAPIIYKTRSVCNSKFSLDVYNSDQEKIYSCNKCVE